MNEAINLVFYVFNKIIDFLFNSAYIAEGVSLGWIIVVVSIFTILFSSILNVPVGVIRARERKIKESGDKDG